MSEQRHPNCWKHWPISVGELDPELAVRLDQYLVAHPEHDVSKNLLHEYEPALHDGLKFILEDPLCAVTDGHVVGCHCLLWSPRNQEWEEFQ